MVHGKYLYFKNTFFFTENSFSCKSLVLFKTRKLAFSLYNFLIFTFIVSDKNAKPI